MVLVYFKSNFCRKEKKYGDSMVGFGWQWKCVTLNSNCDD